MLKVLGDLAEDDYFGLITFDSSVHNWKPELLQATETNVQEAKSFVSEIGARGGKKNKQKKQTTLNIIWVVMNHNVV